LKDSPAQSLGHEEHMAGRLAAAGDGRHTGSPPAQCQPTREHTSRSGRTWPAISYTRPEKDLLWICHSRRSFRQGSIGFSACAVRQAATASCGVTSSSNPCALLSRRKQRNTGRSLRD
jgi:hypothetical protein